MVRVTFPLLFLIVILAPVVAQSQSEVKRSDVGVLVIDQVEMPTPN